MGEKELIPEIEKLKGDKAVSGLVRDRIGEFERVQKADERVWFEELCFCLLTANTSARMGMNTIHDIKGILPHCDKKSLSRSLKECRYRFYNRRAEFIVDARGLLPRLKEEVQKRSEQDARRWLVENIKGMGFKEASHFMRNIGYKNLAIIDRHILKVLSRYGLIDGIPSSLPEKTYREIEKVLGLLSQETALSLAELDFYLWYMETGEVLK
ncbi:MAG: N-glycosylase/DNA lyase [Candidatus Altiarchaeota archaeon]|nr:N-glycosylase/DNA lyase [Candidatus Altiarchaeota archaeon]